MALLRFILVGLVAGWVIGKIRHGHGYGLLKNIFVGAIGSVIGWFLMGFLNIEAPTLLSQLAMAVAGAVLFVLLVGSLKWKRKKKLSKEDDE